MGTQFEVGDAVVVIRHPKHVYPPILKDQGGLVEGKIIEAVGSDLYKVEVDLSFGTLSKRALTTI